MKQRAQRMFIVFFLLLFLGTAALIAFLLGVAYQEKQRQAEVNASNVVEALEARLEATLRRSQATLEELARTTSPAVMSLAVRNEHARAMQRDLALRASHFPEIVGLRLIDAQGNVLYASDHALPNASVRDRSYYIALRQNPQIPLFFSEVTIGRLNRTRQLYMAVPMRNPRANLPALPWRRWTLPIFRSCLPASTWARTGCLPSVAAMMAGWYCACRPW
jgi:C4-dicarboxylate-specific signal transduction histidine kinase